MLVNFVCDSVERGDSYNLFTTIYKMKIDKADALALMSELQVMLDKLDKGEIDE